MISELLLLLSKDLRRTIRNPVPWIIYLVIPIAMSAVVGTIFSRQVDGGGEAVLKNIKLAVVDEDHSELVKIATSQLTLVDLFHIERMSREVALEKIKQDELSAAVIIPSGFAKAFSNQEKVELLLVKSPAQSIGPAIIEELSELVVSALNAGARVFGPELKQSYSILSGGDKDYRKLAGVVNKAGAKIDVVMQYMSPPLVNIDKNGRIAGANDKDIAEKKGASSLQKGGAVGLFAGMLLGLSTMFMIFLGGNAMGDLHNEFELQTFRRYLTLRNSAVSFVLGKIVFTVVTLVICGFIMLGGGALLFSIKWVSPFSMVGMYLVYSFFVASLLCFLVSLAPGQRMAGVLNSMVGMLLGMVGGGGMPIEQLPNFVREFVAPVLPTHWYLSAMRAIQMNDSSIHLDVVVIKLITTSVFICGLSAVLLRNRFRKGA